MQENNNLDTSMKKLRDELKFQQPSEKPANDVLESERSGADGESQFVHNIREELNSPEENIQMQSTSGNTDANTGNTMPPNERLTEKD
jgi:hypothetical protein